jgi:sensor histidine kinase YesM
VTVAIDIQDTTIHFRCQNPIDPSAATKKVIKESGIGIENVKKRLELLYPNQYNLLIEVKEETYCVNLTITGHGN